MKTVQKTSKGRAECWNHWNFFYFVLSLILRSFGRLQNRARAIEIVTARVANMERLKRNAERMATRKRLHGTGDRSDKVRTYNFPQNRVTDHRIGLTMHNLDRVMEGEALLDMVNALRVAAETEAMAELC